MTADELLRAFPKLKWHECIVLSKVIAGKTNVEIARELAKPLSTVRNHIYRGFKSVGVENRAQLI